MYRRVKRDKVFQMENGSSFEPVATLEDEHGGRCQIYNDNHCYCLALQQEHGKYRGTRHIFPEAFDVLVTLDTPE